MEANEWGDYDRQPQVGLSASPCIREVEEVPTSEVRGRTYFLARLSFGLSSIPKIMLKALKTILSKETKVEQATSSYIDDILADENVASMH